LIDRAGGGEVNYLEARSAADAAAVQRRTRRSEEAGVEGRGRGAIPARTACHDNSTDENQNQNTTSQLPIQKGRNRTCCSYL
jgi:hypothetical protein